MSEDSKKDKTKDKTTVYGYFRVPVSSGPEKKRGTGFVCVRLDRPSKDQASGPFHYRATTAFCSPTERQFSRPLARRICDSRMKTTRINMRVEFTSRNRLNSQDAMRTVLQHCYASGIDKTDLSMPVPFWFVSNIDEMMPGVRDREDQARPV